MHVNLKCMTICKFIDMNKIKFTTNFDKKKHTNSLTITSGVDSPRTSPS